MDQEKILQADYLDIIFDNRNKAYGGYELRKTYDRRIKKGVGFLMLTVSAIASFSFIRMEKPRSEVIKPVVRITDVILPPPPVKEIAPPTPPPSTPPAVKMTKFFKPTVEDDNKVKPEDALVEVSKITNSGFRNVDTGADDITPPGDGDRRVAVVTEPAPKATIPIFVEQMPEFRGMQEYLANHINYPAAAREANIQGRVAVTFVVNEDGTISDAKITRGIGGGCDEEALRVIKAMPKWKPGRQNGTALKVMFTQAITFKLE